MKHIAVRQVNETLFVTVPTGAVVVDALAACVL